MTRNPLRAAIVAAASVPVIAFGPAIAAAAPASPGPTPVMLNPQQGPLGAALSCAPLAVVPFAGAIAIMCWA